MPKAPLAVLACAALALGCGEKEESATPSAAGAIADGDEICRAAQERISELRAGAPATRREAIELTRGIIAAFEDEIAKLRALDVPPDLEADLDRYLAARERSLEPLRDGLAAAEQSDEAAYAEAQAAVAGGQVERTRLAAAVGFSECSKPVGSGTGGGGG